MKTIGLIGGMSWHSTMNYYRVVNELVADRRGGHASAKVVLESLDFAEVRGCQVRGDWAAAGRLLAEEGPGHGAVEGAPVHEVRLLDDHPVDVEVAVRVGGVAHRVVGGDVGPRGDLQPAEAATLVLQPPDAEDDVRG